MPPPRSVSAALVSDFDAERPPMMIFSDARLSDDASGTISRELSNTCAGQNVSHYR